MAQLMSIKKNVDVQPGAGVPAIFHCSQGDKGTRIILGLLNNNDSYTIPEGTTAIIRGSRADGTLFTEITADIDTTTEIKFNLTEDMTSVAGPVECEAVMSSGTANVIGTANFIVNVEKSPASVGSVFPGTDAAETWLVNELTNLDISDLDDESVVDAINSKLGGTFETTDAGKVLMVNNDGTVSPEDVDLSGKANESTIAPEFDSSASYTAGQYVYKNGVLYKFTSDHTGAWTGTDAEVVTVVGEVTDLKSAFVNNKKGILNPFDMVANSYVSTDGTITPYVGWKRTDYTYIGDCVSLVAKTSASSQYNCFYNAEKTFISKFTVGTSDTNIAVPSNAVYVIFSNSNAGMDNLTVSFVTKDHKDLNTLKTTVNVIDNLRYINIDETQFVTGYINSTGGISPNNAYKTSPYLRCAMKRIKFNALTKDTISIAFYSDNEGTLVGSYTNTTALSEYPTHEMDVPSETKYIRIAKQINNAYVGSVAPYVISKETVEFIDERIDSIKDEVDALTPASILADVYREVVDDRNLVDNTAYTPHTYVNNSGEIKTTSNPSSSNYGISLSAYIPVIAGKTVYLNNKFLTGNYWAYYNAGKTWIGGKNEYPAWGEHLGICSHVVPTGAAFLRVTSSTEADAQALWASYTGATPTGEVINASNNEYIDYHYYPTNPCDYNGEEISVFNKIICIGDSITSGYFNAASNSRSIAKYAYPAFLQKLTGVETTNKGDGGETSVSWWAAHSSDDFSGYDCAIINLGINDVLTSVSEADTRSAFASIISALKTANTGIKIFIANINPAYSRGNTTYDAINEVIEDIATTTENCYFIDLTQYGHAVGVAYVDGHLTACGYLRLAQDYKAAISWIIKNDPVGFRYVQFIGTNLQPAT